MTSFTIFSDERLEGVADIINTINDSGNNVEVSCIWDAATGQLGRAAFAHHLVYPTDVVVVVVSILDLFNFDREVGLYIPWFTTVEAAVEHYVQTISHVLTELLSLPATPRVIFADLVGVDTLAWTPAFGDFAVQALADCIVPRVNEEIARVNTWSGVPGVPLGRHILYTRQTQDGLIRIHDFRTLINGFLPGPRQRGRWARVIVALLRMFVHIN